MSDHDEKVLENFAKGIAPADGFHHRDHVLVAFLYLQRYPAAEALARFSTALQNFARANGKPHLYHETITWAYVALIHERMARTHVARGGDSVAWESFAAQNADLFAPQNAVIARLYRPETLASDFAKNVFVLPDRVTSIAGE